MKGYGERAPLSGCVPHCHHYTTPINLSTKGAGLLRVMPLHRRQHTRSHCTRIRLLHAHPYRAILMSQFARHTYFARNTLRS